MCDLCAFVRLHSTSSVVVVRGLWVGTSCGNSLLSCFVRACCWRRSGHGQYVRIWYVRRVRLELDTDGRMAHGTCPLRNGTAARVPVEKEESKLRSNQREGIIQFLLWYQYKQVRI